MNVFSNMAGTCSAHVLTCRPQQNDCSEAAKSKDWPCVRVTRIESTTVMVNALLNEASMSAAMASAVVSTLENPTHTPTPAESSSIPHPEEEACLSHNAACLSQCDAVSKAACMHPL